MWRPAGFNEAQPSVFDHALSGRSDIGKMTNMANDIKSGLTQTGIELESNMGRKGLMGLASGLKTLDSARTQAQQQKNASQAGLVSTIGDTVGGIASAGFSKFSGPGKGFGSDLSSGEQSLIMGAGSNMGNYFSNLLG